MDLYEFYNAKTRTYINLKQYDELLSIFEEPLINNYPTLSRRPTIYLLVHLLILAFSGSSSDKHQDLAFRAVGILNEYYNFYTFCKSGMTDNQIDISLINEIQNILIKFIEICFLGMKGVADRSVKMELSDIYNNSKESNDEYFQIYGKGEPVIFAISEEPWRFIYYGLNHTEQDYDIWFPIMDILFKYLKLDLQIKQKNHENTLMTKLLKQLSSRFYVVKVLEIIFDSGATAKRYKRSLAERKSEQLKLADQRRNNGIENDLIIIDEEVKKFTDNYYMNKKIELKRYLLKLVFKSLIFSDVSSMNYTSYLKELARKLSHLNFCEFSNFFFLNDVDSGGDQDTSKVDKIFNRNFLVDIDIIYLQLFTNYSNTFTTKFELKHNKAKSNTIKKLASVLKDNYNFENLVSLEPEIDDLKNSSNPMTQHEIIYGEHGLINRYKRVNLMILLLLHAWIQELSETDAPVAGRYIIKTIIEFETTKTTNLNNSINQICRNKNSNHSSIIRSHICFISSNIKIMLDL